MSEMRKDRRAPASLKVKYKSASVDEFIEQFGVDVSRGGIFIKTKKPLDAGALLKFEFQLHDGSPVIHGVGRVTWRRSEQTARPTAPAGMGIKFIKLDDESRAVVDRIAAANGTRGSRFEQMEGAELAPPMSSVPPPPARDSLPPSRPSSFPAPAFGAATAFGVSSPTAGGSNASGATARSSVTGVPAVRPSIPGAAPARQSAPGIAPMRPNVPAVASSRPAGAGITSSRPSDAAARPRAKPISAPPLSGATLFGTPSPISEPPPPSAAAPAARSSGAAPAARSSGAAPAPLRGNASLSPTLPRAPGAPGPEFKLPKGMVGSFFGDEGKQSAVATKNARDTSEFLASAFSAGGAGQELRAEARAQAEQARREQGPADLANELFGDMGSHAADAALTPLGDPEELAGLPKFNDAKVPSMEEVSLAEQIPSMQELVDDAKASDEAGDGAAIGAGGIEGLDDDDEELFGEADLGAPASTPLQPLAAAPKKTSMAGMAAAVAVLVLAVGGGAYFWMTRSVPVPADTAPQPSAAEPAVAVEPSAQPSAAAPDPAAPAAAEPAGAAQPTAAAPANPAAAEPAGAAPTAAAPAAAAPAAAAAAVTAGPPVEVNVTSWPRAADVLLDGKPAGATPTTLSLPSQKPVDIVVRTSGYASMTKNVVPTAGMDPVRFKLEPLPYVLVLTTDPPGATLSYANKTAISPAPLELGHLEGMISVSIEKDGFQRTSRLMRLDEFQEQNNVMRAAATLSLMALQPTGKPLSGRPRMKAPIKAVGEAAAPSAPRVSAEAPVLSVTPQPKPAEKPVEKVVDKPAEKPAAKPAAAALPDNPF